MLGGAIVNPLQERDWPAVAHDHELTALGHLVEQLEEVSLSFLLIDLNHP